MASVYMDQISWVEYRQRVEQGAVVFLPCGATEQHGPHLPLGTDALLSTALSADVAAQIGGIVAPALAYGYKSQPKCGGGQHFCGTTSLDGATLIALVQDAVREFARHGVKRLVLVLGHYENTWFVTEGIQLALRELGPACDLEVMRLEHWDFCKEETLDDIFPDGFPGFALEHAAVIETSLMLHYLPHLARSQEQVGTAIIRNQKTKAFSMPHDATGNQVRFIQWQIGTFAVADQLAVATHGNEASP